MPAHGDPADEVTHAELSAHFEKAAASYEESAGDTTKSMCRNMLAFCDEFNHPITKGSVVLDNASGPGILTGELIEAVDASSLPELHCADFSAAMIRVLDSKGWGKKYGVQSAVMDAQDLKYPDETFSHSFMNLAIFALPNAEKGTKEIYRTLKPGGISVVSSIKKVGWLPPFQKAQKRVRPESVPFETMVAPEWSTSEKLQSVMEAGGFEHVEVRQVVAPMDMNEWGHSDVGITKMASNQITDGWSDDEKTRFSAALDEEIEAEKRSRIPREMGIWMAVATK